MAHPVSLQISLSPGDYPHARYILPQQLQILSRQVDEIILTIDTRPSKGRFADGWQKNKSLMNELLHQVSQQFSVKILPVDYSPAIKKKVGEFFFNSRGVPDKDYRGGPFYAYFFALYSASNSIIFHLDSDILLGGKSQTWVKEAADLLMSVPKRLVVSPLPGPPHPDDQLRGQKSPFKLAPYTWQISGMSTRLFMMNKMAFSESKIILGKPEFRNQLKALIEQNSNAELPEKLLSAFMQRNEMTRVDFLGSGAGLWSLHPPYRNPAFYTQLPAIIRRIEECRLPDEQFGFYDIIDQLCDWSDAREKLAQQKWWKRINFGNF